MEELTPEDYGDMPYPTIQVSYPTLAEQLQRYFWYYRQATQQVQFCRELLDRIKQIRGELGSGLDYHSEEALWDEAHTATFNFNTHRDEARAINEILLNYGYGDQGVILAIMSDYVYASPPTMNGDMAMSIQDWGRSLRMKLFRELQELDRMEDEKIDVFQEINDFIGFNYVEEEGGTKDETEDPLPVGGSLAIHSVKIRNNVKPHLHKKILSTIVGGNLKNLTRKDNKTHSIHQVIPRMKFQKGSIKTDKLHDDIYVLYGELNQ
jgi:hypothetical protein